MLAAGQLVLRRGGVVRSMANWGVSSLPRPVSHAQMRHRTGHYFAMRVDASPETQAAVRATLNLDPRVIRSSCVRLGDGKLASTSRFGEILWEGAFKRN